MQPHAAKGQQTLFNMGCSKQKHEGDGNTSLETVWVQLLPIKLPGREEGVSMRLRYTPVAQVVAQGEGQEGGRRGRRQEEQGQGQGEGRGLLGLLRFKDRGFG
eukprot:713136-Pelagomonas_calceolata.AAC.3